MSASPPIPACCPRHRGLADVRVLHRRQIDDRSVHQIAESGAGSAPSTSRLLPALAVTAITMALATRIEPRRAAASWPRRGWRSW